PSKRVATRSWRTRADTGSRRAAARQPVGALPAVRASRQPKRVYHGQEAGWPPHHVRRPRVPGDRVSMTGVRTHGSAPRSLYCTPGAAPLGGVIAPAAWDPRSYEPQMTLIVLGGAGKVRMAVSGYTAWSS